jgi:dihydrofolate reductase
MNNMKITLYMAISIDGFIARPNDDTRWVSDTDWKSFQSKIKENGCIVMGKRTYEASGNDFPYKDALNVVLTKDRLLSSNDENVIFSALSPIELVKYLEIKGVNKLLLIGGSKINGAFLQTNLIDEIILSVHPIILNDGIRIFSQINKESNLIFLDSKTLPEGLVHLRYKVEK